MVDTHYACIHCDCMGKCRFSNGVIYTNKKLESLKACIARKEFLRQSISNVASK